jgi:hypothetical protein
VLKGRSRRGVVLLLVSVLLLGSAAEWGARRFVLPSYWRPIPPLGTIDDPRGQEWLALQRAELAGTTPPTQIGEFDVELGWRNRSGVRVFAGKYSTHAEGWRGAQREYAPLPPPGHVRLAAFGESFTFGHEVADDACWAARVEALDPRFEVPNFGVGAYGTDQALLLAEEVLPRLHAHLVLVGLLLENIGRNVNRYQPLWNPRRPTPLAKPRFVLEGGRLRLVPLPFRDRLDFVDAVADGSVLARLSAHEAWSTEDLPALLRWSGCGGLFAARRAAARRDIVEQWREPGEAFDVTLAIVDRFRELAREQGASDAVLLVFPSSGDLMRLQRQAQPYWSSLIEALEARTAPYVDFSSELAAQARIGGLDALFETDGHYSALGNHVVARVLVEWLQVHALSWAAAHGPQEDAIGR